MTKTFSLLALLFLGGCATTHGLPADRKGPVCEALVGPIHYNSKNRKSDYYAAGKLAPQLSQRNRVGVDLRCPQYRW